MALPQKLRGKMASLVKPLGIAELFRERVWHGSSELDVHPRDVNQDLAGFLPAFVALGELSTVVDPQVGSLHHQVLRRSWKPATLTERFTISRDDELFS